MGGGDRKERKTDLNEWKRSVSIGKGMNDNSE